MFNEFGRLLKLYRKESLLTQEKLRAKLREQGYVIKHNGTISRWERGLRRPNQDIVEYLEDIFFGQITGKLLKAVGYPTESKENATADQVISYLKKKEHDDHLADIARILLSNGMDTLTIAEPIESQKENPDWIENFKKSKYRVYKHDTDEVLQANQKQLIFEMKQNVEAVHIRYKNDAGTFNRFLSHLKAEPKIGDRELLEV